MAAESVEEALSDILQWAERIRRYAEGHDLTSFAQNELVQDAVIRCLEVIGEASGRILSLDPEFEREHPLIELRRAYRARSRTAHGYGNVEPRIVWETSTVSAQGLAGEARRIPVSRKGLT